MGARGNENNQREWEGNGNKTWLNLGLGMGMNHLEWEGMGWKKTFPLISNLFIHETDVKNLLKNDLCCAGCIKHRHCSMELGLRPHCLIYTCL